MQLAVGRESYKRLYLIDIKYVACSLAESGTKKGGLENAGKSRDVDENTCRKNVMFWASRDVDENKRDTVTISRC